MYVPLRCHGHHTLLNGVDSPARLLERAGELGLPALALADVDSLGGVVELLQADRAGEADVRPIVAAELSDAGGRPGRLIALVEDETGYRNLCRLVSARQVGYDPGADLPDDPDEREVERARRARGAEAFDLVQAAVAHQEGLLFLADHPRLLLGLFGRVPARRLLAALSPASLARGGVRDVRALGARARNTHLDRGRAGDERAPEPDADDPSRSLEQQLAARKTPPPARPVPAMTLLDAARATGAALVAVPDVYHAFPGGHAQHRLRVAIHRNALLADLPEAWLAPQPAHLPSTAELAAIFHGVPDVPGAWPLEEGPLEEGPPEGAPPAEASADAAALAQRTRQEARPARRLPAPLRRTLEVAAACRYTPPLGGVLFPEVELEPGETAYSRLCNLAFDGARARFRPLRPEVLRRLDHELTTIQQLGFAPYFLLVQRIARFAEEAGIPHVGRGSAADSLVAYCLRLTDADPFRYRLPFERFLNPARRDRPDVDLDFCWRRRDEVLDHVFELFGDHRTAMISTLNTFGPRAAFREAALAHGVPPAEITPWSRRLPMYLGETRAHDGSSGGDGETVDGATDGSTAGDDPPVPEAHDRPPEKRRRPALDPELRATLAGGAQAVAEDGDDDHDHDGHDGEAARRRDTARPVPRPRPRLDRELPPRLRSNPLAVALARVPEARDLPLDDARFTAVLQDAAELVGVPRHFGLHPGGVVVAPGRITDVVACQRAAKGPLVTQLDKDAVEAVGLVKMDLLGNRALTTLDDCLGLLRARGVEVDLEALPEDDPATAETLRRGLTLGCFQVESPGMRHLLQQSGARDMDAVIQAVALIRPGPAGSGMKDAYVRRYRGLEDPTPPHPRLVDVLWDTHGVMLYQEDVMQVAARIAGLELSEADQLRRALQKRRLEELGPLRRRFFEGAAAQGVPVEEAAPVWDLIANFASFAFCKAHAVTYGRIAYRAAWLKTHHPAEFLTAFLCSETGYYPRRVYVEEARRLGVAILGPDVNRSAAGFTVEPLDPRGAARAGDGDGSEGGARTPGHALRVGLGQAKGLTGATLERLLASRAQEGPFLSLPDFLARSGARRDETETLIRCGAFDAFDRTRPELLWRLHLLCTKPVRAPRGAGLDAAALDACRTSPLDEARARTTGWGGRGLGLGGADLAPGQDATLFPAPETPTVVLPGLPDTTPLERGREEFELLGLTLHQHPVTLFPCPGEARAAAAAGGRGPAPASGTFHSDADRTRPVNPIRCAQLAGRVGARVTLRGWPAATRRVRTEAGELMRFLTLEDESGLAEVVLFPDVYRRDGHHLDLSAVLLVTGTVDDQMGACTLRAERVW